MPISVPNRSGDRKILPLTDFSHGIYNGGGYATRFPPSAPGVAQETDTYGCIAVNGGGIGPLPKRTTLTGPTLHADGIAGAPGGPHVPIGFLYGGNGIGYDNFLIVQSGTRVHGYYRDTSNVWNHVPFEDTAGVQYTYLTLDGGGSGYTGCSFSYLTYNYVGGTSMPVTAVWDAPGLYMPSGTRLWPFFYDNLDGTFKGIAQTANTAHHAIVISHLGDNANLCRSSNLPYICELTYYEGGTNDAGTPTPYVSHFFLDHRALFMTYGSQSTGELLLVAKNGPAAMIRGAYDYPQLILLPAVMPCGGDGMEAIPTPAGLLYVSEDRGAFTWNGDNATKHVSSQLRPDFYKRATDIRYAGQTTGGGANAPYHNVHGAKWGDWAVLPNNWIWESMGGPKSDWGSVPGAWWKLEDDTTYSSAMWSVNDDGTQLTGVQDQIGSADTDALSYYRLDSLRSTFSWKSQPIAIGTPGAMVRVHDVEIRAIPTKAASNQTVTITLTGSDGSTETATFTINGAVAIPIRQRQAISVTGYDVIVRIQSDSGDANYPAPVVQLWLGYEDAGAFGA